MTNRFLSSLASLSILLFVVFSCSEDEPGSKPDPQPEPPAVLDLKIIGTTFPENLATVDIQDSVVINFQEQPELIQVMEGVKYRAKVDVVEINNVAGSVVWAEDSINAKIYPKDMLTANTAFQLTVKAHWEIYESGTWKIVVWEEAQLKEEKVINFSTAAPAFTVKKSNILYEYPIDNQYHFLKNESPAGFIKLKRGQASLFALAGYQYKAKFKKNITGETLETTALYNQAEDLVTFMIPDGLVHETIYELSLVAVETGTGNSHTLYSSHFRTSKYDTFAEKFNSIVYNGNTFSVLIAPWRGHYIDQYFTSSGEYFDTFELGIKEESVTLGATIYNVPYADNLITFEAIASGNDWYTALNSLLYAPWTEASFKPTVSRDTTILGYPPVRMMSISNGGGGMLTSEIIAANNAPAITATGNSAIRHSLSLVIWKDFNEIQAQVVNKYIQLANIPERENRIIFGSMPSVQPGVYKYKVHYTLPSGEITSTLEKQMSF